MADERIMDFFNESNNDLIYKPKFAKKNNQFNIKHSPNNHYDRRICNNKDGLNENVLKNIYRLEQVEIFIFLYLQECLQHYFNKPKLILKRLNYTQA